MKIINLSFADSAGAAYTLSHAINKQYKNVHSINLRANNNYINYPTFAEMRNYDAGYCKTMIENADVIVFHTTVKPFFISDLNLSIDAIKDKVKILYFHGSDCRNYGKGIITQADEYFGDYRILVSTPDLLELVPEATWMPVCRSFNEIRSKYLLNRRDQRALTTFKANQRKLILCHAPTNPQLKGSTFFYRVISEVVQDIPYAEYLQIQNLSWDACMRALSFAHIFYDQMILGSYGMAAVEAAVFKMPIFCKLSPFVIDKIKEESGMPQPFIQFASEDDLRTQSFMLVGDEKLRRELGKRAYDYCKAMHDDKPVAERFMGIVKDMS